MSMPKQERRIISLSIMGICFASMYWNDGINDFIYDRYKHIGNITIICSVITFFCSSMLSVANIIVMYIPRSKIIKCFKNLLLICALLAILIGFTVQFNHIFIFILMYFVFDLVFEILSVLHYGYEVVATEDDRLIHVENKRKIGFFMVKGSFVLICNFLFVQLGNLGFLIACIASSITFIVIYFIQQNISYVNIKPDVKNDNIIQKFNLRKYSKNFKLFVVASIFIQFSTINLVMIFSYHLMDSGMEFSTLKITKSITVLIAILAFFVIEILNKYKKILFGYVLSLFIVLILSILNVSSIFMLAILFGAISFQGMLACPARYFLLANDSYMEENIQKDAILNIISNIGGILSSTLLLVPFRLAIFMTSISLLIAIISIFYIFKTRLR